jgi:regulator of RNase E activity RraB
MTKLANQFDFANLSNAETPRCLVYDIDSGEEVATMPATAQGEMNAERVARALSSEPLLLAALKSLLEAIPVEYDGWGQPMDKDLAKAMEDAEHAIAVGEGRVS